MKKFSLSDWLKQFGLSVRRFPVAVVLLVCLTCFVLFVIHGGKVTDKWQFFYFFYPATGAVLAISLQLLTEDFKRRWTAVLTQVLVHAAWLGVSFYLVQFDRFSLPQFIAVSATVVTMVLSVFLLCFYRKGDDVPFWNFSGRTVVAMIAGAFIGGLLTLGLILFVQSLEWLFGVKLGDKVFADIPTVCMLLLAPLLFMNLIPAGKDKRVFKVPSSSGFIKGVVQYLFIPLLLLYMATLYIYAAKILFTWQLPVGWVSYLVTASMLGMVILLYVTYPLQHEQGNSFFRKVTRWLPLAMLPLLALMTVAIGRRLADYGITVSRLYLLVFNIWCYVVCIGLLLGRNKRIWWIPASFAVVLFLISVGPQSIPNITQRQLLGEARRAFAASGITQLPLTGDQYDKWLDSVDDRVAASIDAKLDYLQRDYGYESTSALLAKDALTGTHDKLTRDGTAAVSSNGFYNGDMITSIKIPQGYSWMSKVDFHSDLSLEDGDKVLISIVPSTGGPADVRAQAVGGDDVQVASAPSVGEYKFELSYNQLVARDMDRNHDSAVEPLVIDNGRALLIVDRFSFTLFEDKTYYLSGDGILFTK